MCKVDFDTLPLLKASLKSDKNKQAKKQKAIEKKCYLFSSQRDSSENRPDLLASTLVELPGRTQYIDPLAVQHIDNRSCRAELGVITRLE